MSQLPPLYCSSCGKPNAPDAKFCNECAKPMQQAPPPPQPVWSPPAQIPCPSCHMGNPATNEFCYLCHKPLFYARQNSAPLPPSPLPVAPKPVSKLFYIGLGIFFFTALGIILIGVQAGKLKEKPTPFETPTAKAPAPPPPRTELNAQVRFTGTQFVITNKESVDLTNVKMEINGGIFSGGYQLLHDRMKANETYIKLQMKVRWLVTGSA